jgi:hypothetical protein
VGKRHVYELEIALALIERATKILDRPSMDALSDIEFYRWSARRTANVLQQGVLLNRLACETEPAPVLYHAAAFALQVFPGQRRARAG